MKGGLRRVASTTGFSLVDQASVSVGNFALNLWLARTLEPSAYGAFALAFSIFLLAGSAHGALVTEPLLVLGNADYRPDLAAYVRRVLQLNWFVGGLFGALFLFAGVVAMALGAEIAASLIALAVASPLILFHWTTRRACYTALEPRWAALSNVLYLVTILSLAVVTARLGILSAPVAFLVMGTGSFMAGMFALRELRALPKSDRAIPLQEIIRAHWVFGRWLLGASGLKWLRSNAPAVVLPVFAGMAAVGQLKALSVFLLPITHAITAVTPLFSPLLTRQVGTARFAPLVLLLGGTVLGLNLAYYLGLVLFGEPLLDLAYGSKYVHLAPLFVAFGLAPVFASIGHVLGAALGAMQRTSGVFTASLASAVAAIVATAILVRPFGVLGAVTADVLASASFTVALAFGVRRQVRLQGTA